MSNINFNCDVCGREVQGCTFVNGMKFCAKCYQETFGGTKELEEENKELKKLLNNKILLVEDGSVDVDKLEGDGFYVIIYRQGAKPPMWLTHQHEDKGE